MIRIVVDRVFSGDLHYQEMFGLSTDTKPTEGLITGSRFTEADTGVQDGLIRPTANKR